MFTGLIEVVGLVVEVRALPVGLRVRISTDLAGELSEGDSVSVNGVCLTAVLVAAKEFHVDVSPETLRVTSLGALRMGDAVNLERPLSPTSRLGGHFVQGHVDAVGFIDEIRQDVEFWWLTVHYPEELRRYIARKGSIAADGISLTVADLGADDRFGVQIVPYTWEHTHLHTRAVKDPINLECDIIGKYVANAVEVVTSNI